jgi:multimeric flavodoxin WrbA
MKILGVMGSPRKKGNTHALVSAALDGAADLGAAVETVFLGDLAIRECDGCHACWAGKPCPKHDDMNALYPRLVESDAIVFGTPVYWYGPTALMKAFIDRFVYFNCPENRQGVAGKSAAVVVPFEEEDESTGQPLIAFFEKSLRYLGMELVGHLLVPGVTNRGDVLRKPECLARAKELGGALVRARGS